MHPLQLFKSALTKARVRALEQHRVADALAELGEDRLLDAAQVAAALRITVKTARARLAAGEIRGAYLAKRKWRVRRADLLLHMELELGGRTDVSAIDLLKAGA